MEDITKVKSDLENDLSSDSLFDQLQSLESELNSFFLIWS